jgi:2,5-diketo-D-gluconate reductase B
MVTCKGRVVMKMIGPMPQMGFGTWKRAGEDGAEAVLQALQAGYRHIDTASAYGNEEDVGQALARSGIARADLFVTTKVWPDSYGAGEVTESAKRSLEKLKLSQVDLLLLHWPSKTHAVEDYVAELATVQEQGLTKHIGVSNFNRTQLASAISVLGQGHITTNQIEVHPLFQNTSMIAHMAGLGIPATAYTPLARGAIKGHPVLEGIAKAHGATASQVALAFLMAEGHVVIPTSSSPQRMAENLKAQSLTLTPEEISSLRAIDENKRMVEGAYAPDWSS